MTRRRRGIALVAGSAIAVFVAACGDDDFENAPRPAVPVELTGVIQEDKVTVSPAKVGAGAILITISNQTKAAHTLILEGETIREQVGPVNPLDTATLQKTLKQGSYEIRAGSSKAVAREIKPAKLTIGKPRSSSSNEVLQP